MATNFPTSVDNFTNPTANDSLNLPSHSTQHANANDAIEAIETTLFTGGINYTGLVHISSLTFSSQAAANFNNVFSSPYENYAIKFNLTSQTNNGGAIYLRLRGSGSDLATTNYDNHILGIDASANNFVGNFNYYYLGALASDMGHSEVQLFKPASPVNSRTITHTGIGYNGNQIYYSGGARFTTTTAADGFSILTASGTFSGTVRLYGYRNA